ncbi:MAG: RNA-guided endonuclease InsQ/TnpB family protein [Halococcoides sp.]
MTANLVQEAIRRAVHAVDSGVDRWKKGKRTNKPVFTSWSMVYDKRSATVYRNKISLSTVNGRIECDFELPADSPTPYEEYVLSEDYEFRTSTLQYDQATDEFYFHVKTRKVDTGGEAVEIEVSNDTEHQTVLGIDLGVNSLAVSSTGTFWSGDEYDHWIQEFDTAGHKKLNTLVVCSGEYRRESQKHPLDCSRTYVRQYEKRRAEMQHRETQAAHNALLRLGKRKRAWRKQYIHTVANEIVAEAVAHDCDVIVFEDLTDIRERLPHADWHHVWAFRRLVEYVEYKAPERGVAVEQVEPDHTSQRCSHTDCGFTHEDNRNGEQFRCLKCGYEINADYNGAKNIGLRYMRKRQHRLRSSPTSGSVDAPVDVRVNDGILILSDTSP